MRVLLVCPGMHPREGGPPRTVIGTALALVRAGMDVEIATIGLAGDDDETQAAWPELFEAGVRLHIFPRGYPQLIGRSGALNKFLALEGDRFDLLHVHCIWETALADAAASFRGRGKPTFVSAHGMLDRWQMRRSTFKKNMALRFFGTGAMLRHADALFFGTQEEAGEASDLDLGAPVVLMPNGTIPYTGAGADEARARMVDRYPAIRDWRRTVLFFSRLHPKKGLDLLIAAFARIQDEYPDVGLFAAAIAQDEAYGDAIRAQIAGLPASRIVLASEPGGLDATSAFSVADIFCLPSHQEGFSQAILEGASAGLPVLITDKCHMPEFGEEGAGLIVSDTVDGLVGGLRALLALSEPELRAMGERGRNIVSSRYTWEHIAERLTAAYRGVSLRH